MSFGSQNKRILIGKETTWGTPVTPTKDVGIVINSNRSFERELVNVGAGAAGSIETQAVTTAMVVATHTMTIEFQHGRLLEYALGSVAHVQTTGDWKHTFSIAQNAPSMTIEDSNSKADQAGMKMNGMTLESLELSYADGEPLRMNVTSKGRPGSSLTSVTAAVISDLCTYARSMVHVSINGTEASEIQEASITFEKKVELVGGAGSNQPQSGQDLELKFKYAAKLGFTDETYQELFLGGSTLADTSDPTAYDFEINAHNGVTLGSGRREVKVTLTNCMSGKFNEVMSQGGITYIDIDGEGTLSAAFSVDDISDTNW